MRLSITLPTFNERNNLVLAVDRIDRALGSSGIAYEIIVVDDDSPDRTWELVEDLARSRQNLHLIRRIGRRGLSSAVVEGFEASRGELLLVMDADLQHDSKILPEMLNAASDQSVDLVVATRYALGGSTGQWTTGRWLLSRLATMMSWAVIRTHVSDPMSGYFLVSNRVWKKVHTQVNQRGFKILLEIIARSPPLVFKEVGYTFQLRQYGESKLDGNVSVAYLRALYNLSFGRIVPLRLLLYCVVGTSGLGVNLAALWLLHDRMGLEPTPALVAAISVTMVSNFLLNNAITFWDRRHSDWPSLIVGLGLFALICSFGAVINFAVTRFAISSWGLNIYLADLAGILIAMTWNFNLNRRITWRHVEAYF